MKNNLYNYWLCDKPHVVSYNFDPKDISHYVTLDSGRKYIYYIEGDTLSVGLCDDYKKEIPSYSLAAEYQCVEQFAMEINWQARQ